MRVTHYNSPKNLTNWVLTIDFLITCFCLAFALA